MAASGAVPMPAFIRLQPFAKRQQLAEVGQKQSFASGCFWPIKTIAEYSLLPRTDHQTKKDINLICQSCPERGVVQANKRWLPDYMP